MNHLEKEVAPLSTFESKLIKENQNLLKKLGWRLKQYLIVLNILLLKYSQVHKGHNNIYNQEDNHRVDWQQ